MMGPKELLTSWMQSSKDCPIIPPSRYLDASAGAMYICRTTILNSGFSIKLEDGVTALNFDMLKTMYRTVRNTTIRFLKEVKVLDRYGRPTICNMDMSALMAGTMHWKGDPFGSIVDFIRLYSDLKTVEWINVFPRSFIAIPILHVLNDLGYDFHVTEDDARQGFDFPINCVDFKHEQATANIGLDVLKNRVALTITLLNCNFNKVTIEIISNTDTTDAFLSDIHDTGIALSDMHIIIGETGFAKAAGKLLLTIRYRNPNEKREVSVNDILGTTEVLQKEDREVGHL